MSEKVTRIVHVHNCNYDVYVGRPSKYGNPFSHKLYTDAEVRVNTVEDAVSAYRDWLNGKIHVKGKIPPTKDEIFRELKGKILACWCKPKICHGDVLVEIIEEMSTVLTKEIK